jgi:L-fucose isomerase-like protein
MERRGEKLLLFGGVPSDYLEEWEITNDLALAESKLNVRFEPIPDEELVGRYRSLGEEEAARLTDDLVEGASSTDRRKMPPAPLRDEIVKAVRLFIAMQQLVEEREADAVTITCGSWIRSEDLPVPCVALMLFQEQGLPAACQGDIDALLTMVMVKRATGWTSFMGGAVEAQGHLGLSHCVLCRTMPDPDREQAYVISNYHGRKESPTIWVDVPVGETVTAARLIRNLERLLLFKGEIIANQASNSRCRNTLVVNVPDRARVFDAVKGIQNHYVAAFGDHTQALTEMAEDRGIDVVRLDEG